MEREYIQVRPSREKLNPDDIVSHISSLHKLTRHGSQQSIRSRLNPLEDSSENVPEFEFLAISQGKDSPVEFLYGTEEKHLNALKNRLTTAYPASFDVEIIEVDVLEKIIPPEKYAPDDFVKKLKDGHLLFDPDAKGTAHDIEGEDKSAGSAPTKETNTTGPDGISSQNTSETDVTNTETDTQSNAVNASNEEMLSLDVARSSDTTELNDSEDAVTASGSTQTIDPEDIDGYDMLEELDAGLLDVVDLPDTLDANYLEADIDGPTWTEDGEILARPTLEHGIPVAARWNGDGERKKDWMTTMKMFSKVASPGDEDVQDRAPLATLIQHLAASDLPIAFQVVFKRIEDWSRQAERRKDNLHLNRDTLGQKVMYELGEVLHSPSKERRQERMRDYMEDIGESADMNAESPIAGDVGKRRKLIDNKIPKRTFRANLRAVSVANDEVPVADVERTMDDLASVLDHLDGYFYGLNPTILHDGDGYRNKKQATEEFHRLVNREIVSGSGKQRADIVVNADELSNFITVPSSENLTVEGVRGTRAEAEARDPLPKPDPDLMREFHSPGMRIGYALDKEAKTEPVPTQVPPSLLTTHYGRFATTGAGKSKALINDILSLHENTDGPTVLVDPKGDGMTQNYMKAHFERFGEENFKENVIHFPVPDILPGFSFFNIQSEIDQRYDESSNRTREDIRGDVIQNKADHYQELLKLVMGVDSYNDSKVAPILISSFIKILYDEEYVKDKQRKYERGETDDYEGLNDRPNKNWFTHHQLEQFSRKVKDGKVPQPVSEKNKPIQHTIQEQIEGDEHTFSVIMNSVFNRLNYVREDQHLRRMFNNAEPRFDFRDHLEDNKVILFDLGDLRDDATLVMTGMILTQMWDSVSSADQKTCTQNHDSIEDCKAKARENGLDPGNPQCREPWPDSHVVNLILDEAASITTAGVMTRMLEQGRSFHLSVGLSMQFPEQMKDASDRVYKNVLNNVATKLIGKITLDEEIAKAMAHEGLDVDEFNNRISALPRGEWIAQLPSPNFMETGPEPFSLQPLPIPAGHPESRHVLTSEADQRYHHFMKNQVHHRAQHEYGVERENNTSSDTANVDTTNLQGADDTDDTSSTATSTAQEPEEDEEVSNTEIGDVNLPSGVLNEDFNSEDDEDDNGSEIDDTASEPTQQDNGTTDTGSDVDNPTTVETVSFGNVGDDESSGQDTPPYLSWDSMTEVYTCLVCGNEYYANDKFDAEQCCIETIEELQDELGDPNSITSVTEMDTDDSFVKSTEEYLDHTGEISKYSTVVQEDSLTFDPDNTPSTDDEITVEREKELLAVHNKLDPVTIGGVISATVAEIPPEYQRFKENLIDWYIDQLNTDENAGMVSDEVDPTSDGIQQLIFETPPADVSINTSELIEVLTGDVDETLLARWRNNGCDPAFKRFYTGRVSVPGTRLTRPGKYGGTYSVTPGLGSSIQTKYRSPAAYGLPKEPVDTSGNESIERVETPDISKSHLDEHGITRDEAAFLKAVVKAMNRDLPGYNLRDSMSGEIKSLYEVDVDKLVEKGYLKNHTGVNNRIYYTVTPDGQEACRMTKEHGFMIGDLGADTPHRVGVELTKQYYEQLPDVQRVELSPSEGSSELDLAVYDSDGDRIAIAEVEAGRTTADTDADDSRSSLKDYAEVRRDYVDLAESDGDAVWVVRNHEVVGALLRALRGGDEDIHTFDISDDRIKAVENRDLKIPKLNEELAEIGDPGVDKLLTYKQVRNKLTDNETE